MLLDGKAAVVTGSGSGLGRAFAIALAKAGASVVVNARTASDVASVVDEIRKDGGTAEGCVVSVASMEGGRQIIQTAIDKFGRIDILVNNAGIAPSQPLVTMSEQEFDDAIATDLKGAFACARFAAPYMVKQKWGRIINMSSGAARGLRDQTGYSAAKAGLVSMSVVWAQELGNDGITVNAIRASARTRITERAKERRIRQAIALGQKPPLDMGLFPPEMAAPLVVFLASEQAGWITGQFISIDGPKLALYSHTRAVSTAFMPDGWTVELMLQHFKGSVGAQLEEIGWRKASGERAT